MRISTGVSKKARNQLTLEGFKGVDFSSSPLNVSTNRASSMRNLINENGVNKKRSGWNELIRFVDSNGFARKINGIFSFNINREEKILVHAGTRIYQLIPKESGYDIVDLIQGNANVDSSSIQDARSQAFVYQDKIWILCGDYLCFGKFDGENYELRRVKNDKYTYIPMTTMGIENESVTTAQRSTFESVNVLTNKRKNGMLGTTDNASKSYTWRVDAGVIDKDTSVEVEIDTANGIAILTNSGSDKTKLLLGDEVKGTINFGDGKITLTNIDTTPVIASQDNIFVTFERNVEGLAERITHSKFGVCFGSYAVSDRLFVAGNENYPNFDFHSAMEDFSYFPEYNEAVFGSTGAKIVGYSRLGDGTLAILKEYSAQEPTIYFRTTGTLTKADGTTEDIFPIQPGAIGEGAVSSFAQANLSGDNLFLSSNGIYGIVLAENIAVNERYARERSKFINSKLTLNNLKEAVAVVYKNRYYLAVDDVCYVLDARFKTTTESDMDDTYNYECFYFDNIPARCFNIYNDDLYFGTADGRICVFDGEYADRTYQEFASGNISVNYEGEYDDKVVVNKALSDDLKTGHLFEFRSDVYAVVFHKKDITQVYNNRVYSTFRVLNKLNFGQKVKLDEVEGATDFGDKDYYIANIDLGNLYFTLEDEEGNEVAIDGSSKFRMIENLKGQQLIIANENDDVSPYYFQLRKDETADLLEFALFNHQKTNAQDSGYLIYRNPVEAEWISPILDLGSNNKSKTLDSITIQVDSSANGLVNFGYETRKVDSMLESKQVKRTTDAEKQLVFSFDDIDFNNFTFETAFASSYTKKMHERNFNYIIFKWISKDDKNSAVNSIGVVYHLCKNNRGLK